MLRVSLAYPKISENSATEESTRFDGRTLYLHDLPLRRHRQGGLLKGHLHGRTGAGSGRMSDTLSEKSFIVVDDLRHLLDGSGERKTNRLTWYEEVIVR